MNDDTVDSGEAQQAPAEAEAPAADEGAQPAEEGTESNGG